MVLVQESVNEVGVILFESYNGDIYYTELSLMPDTQTTFLYYNYNDGQPYKFNGSLWLYAPAYDQYSTISFSYVSGNAVRAVNESICSKSVLNILYFVDHIYFDYLWSYCQYSVNNFGFNITY